MHTNLVLCLNSTGPVQGAWRGYGIKSDIQGCQELTSFVHPGSINMYMFRIHWNHLSLMRPITELWSRLWTLLTLVHLLASWRSPVLHGSITPVQLRQAHVSCQAGHVLPHFFSECSHRWIVLRMRRCNRVTFSRITAQVEEHWHLRMVCQHGRGHTENNHVRTMVDSLKKSWKYTSEIIQTSLTCCRSLEDQDEHHVVMTLGLNRSCMAMISENFFLTFPQFLGKSGKQTTWQRLAMNDDFSTEVKINRKLRNQWRLYIHNYNKLSGTTFLRLISKLLCTNKRSARHNDTPMILTLVLTCHYVFSPNLVMLYGRLWQLRLYLFQFLIWSGPGPEMQLVLVLAQGVK